MKTWRVTKKALLPVIMTIVILALSGCGNKVDYSLPDSPIRFDTGTFVNPYDSDDTYLSIRYNDRTYIGYGTLNGRIKGKDVGDCLGFIVQDGVQMEDARIFLLTADPDENYLVRLETEGIMNQPDFFRAIDTVGQNIDTPDFIEDLGYDVWKLDSMQEATDIDAFYRHSVTKDYQDIRDLDETFDTGQAQMDNCFVVGAMVHNDYLYYEFMEKCGNNEDAFIRVVQSTVEGDAIIYDVLHIAGTEEHSEEIQLVVDSTRDNFAAESDRNIVLTHYSGTMEYEEDGHEYWVAYNGEPEDVSLTDENTFVIVFIN